MSEPTRSDRLGSDVTGRREATLEFGPGGSQQVDVGEGEYFEVPKNTVHREGNTSPQVGEVVISRVGEGQLVFPVDGPDAT